MYAIHYTPTMYTTLLYTILYYSNSYNVYYTTIHYTIVYYYTLYYTILQSSLSLLLLPAVQSEHGQSTLPLTLKPLKEKERKSNIVEQIFRTRA